MKGVLVYVCKYHEVLNPVSRHIVSSYSTCSLVKRLSLNDIAFIGREYLNVLSRNFELDVTDPELVRKLIGREIGGDEYVKLVLED